MRKLIAGNWKMNGSKGFTAEIIGGIVNAPVPRGVDVLVCVPFPYIVQGAAMAKDVLSIGAQDCSVHRENGAYTGEVSARMIGDCGARYVIVGHSERRQYHSESDAVIAQKASAAHEAGLIAIICVGESESEREAGHEKDIVAQQIAGAIPASANAQNTVIAYEPVWAIGTGKTASADDVAVMHSFIRQKLQERLADSQKMRILYGGSMKPENAAQLLSIRDVDGGLIGGASLKLQDFMAIVRAGAEIA